MYFNDLVQKVKNILGLAKENARKNAVIIGRWRRKVPVPTPTPAPQPNNPVKLIEHLLNDPTTPDLKKEMNAPTPPQQNVFVVKGFKGGGFAQGSPEYQAANCYVTLSETLSYINKLGGSNTIPRWRRAGAITVLPRAGVDLNAFFDGKSLQFFYVADPRVGGSVFSVDSADIVSHECGHAILDCYRPDLWSAAFIEVGAFHEAFGDFCALMHSLQHDELIERALAETGGDLSKSNVISRMAEQFGKAIYMIDPQGRSPDYLRNAVNGFKYVDPGTLPEDSTDDKLAAEVHNFSRIMVGALYDIFDAIYRDQKSAGVNPLDAVKVARDTLCTYVIKAVLNAPVNAKFYESIAKMILWADQTVNGGKYQTQIREVFTNRNIVTTQIKMLSAPKCPNNEHIVKSEHKMEIRLSDYIVRAQGQDENPLYDVEVELPTGEANLYDTNGMIHDSITVTTEETLKAAQDFVHYLHKTGKVSSGSSTPWEIKDGKLVRTRTCCY